MEKVKILVVEDEVIIADNICSTLKELDYKPLRPVVSYSRAIQMLEKELPDLVILDIQLAGRRDGIDLAWKIKDDYDIPFIFLTSNADPSTVERAKKVSPPAYLVKPFNKEELFTAIEIALYNYSSNKIGSVDNSVDQVEDNNGILIKDAIFVKHKQSFQKIYFSDILFIKSEHVYVNIFTKDQKSYLVRSTMTAFKQRLPDYFFQIQRSYTVNVNAIDNIGLVYVKIGSHELPFGQGYRTQLLEKVNIE